VEALGPRLPPDHRYKTSESRGCLAAAKSHGGHSGDKGESLTVSLNLSFCLSWRRSAGSGVTLRVRDSVPNLKVLSLDSETQSQSKSDSQSEWPSGRDRESEGHGIPGGRVMVKSVIPVIVMTSVVSSTCMAQCHPSIIVRASKSQTAIQ